MPGAEVAAQAWARVTVPHIAQRPVMRRSPDGGVSFPRSSSKGYRYEVAIRSALPNRPATVPTFDHATGRGRLLVLDLDTSRVPAEGAADRPGYVAAVASRAVALVAECGGRALVDVSPSGGRHVYVLFAEPLPFKEMRALARALARRLGAVVDTSPMDNSDGQIRGPGAPHKSAGGRLTGFMTLTCSVAEAEAICARPNARAVWEALQAELAAELDTVHGGRVWEARHPGAPDAAAGVELDAAGEPFRPRLGGRATLSAALEHLARTGEFDPARYVSRSEARQAVLSSAAARGWRLEQVRRQLAGEWATIASWWRDEARLTADWAKAVAFTSTPSPASSLTPCSAPAAAPAPPPGAQKVGEPVRDCNTSEFSFTPPAPLASTSAPGSPCPAPAATVDTSTTDRLYKVKAGGVWGVELTCAPWSLSVYQRIRTWQNAMRIVERLMETEWGERALTYRALLRAIGAAAQMTGRLEVEFGSRQLAYMAAVDHTTAARALQRLRTGPYALIDHVRDAHGVRGDLYQLTIPDPIAADAARRSWRPGRIEAIHPAFRPMTRGAAFAYEALTDAELTATEISAAALLPRTTTYDALTELAAAGLAERGPGGWRRGDVDLDELADRNGGRADAAHQLAGHRADRADWHTFLGITDQLTTAPSETVPLATPTPAAAERRRSPAPPWLIPPPRRPRITEADLAPPAEAHTVLADLAAGTEPADPSDTGPPTGHQVVLTRHPRTGDLVGHRAAPDRPRAVNAPNTGTDPAPAPRTVADPSRPAQDAHNAGPAQAPEKAADGRAAEPDEDGLPSPAPPSAGEIITAHDDSHAQAAARGAALARRLLAESRRK